MVSKCEVENKKKITINLTDISQGRKGLYTVRYPNNLIIRNEIV